MLAAGARANQGGVRCIDLLLPYIVVEFGPRFVLHVHTPLACYFTTFIFSLSGRTDLTTVQDLDGFHARR